MKKILFLIFALTPLILFGAQMDLTNADTVFVPPSDPLLRLPVSLVPVDQICSAEVQTIIDKMYSIAAPERSDTDSKVMVGLAAPQIGVLKQIILVDLSVTAVRRDLGELRAFINPKIIWYSEEKDLEREGCYSVDSRLFGVVPRSTKIKIIAYDRDGNLVEQELSGFTARIFQHEVDHLHGVRFPDQISTYPNQNCCEPSGCNPSGCLHWVEPDQFLEYRKSWQIWPHVVSHDVWDAMKHGREFKFCSKSNSEE